MKGTVKMGREFTGRGADPQGRLHLKPEQGTPKSEWTRLRTLELLGLGGGIAALFLGLVLCAVGWAEGAREGGHVLVIIGTVLLLVAAPLLLLGAHCLDLEESRARRTRSAIS
jgi:hypothetical protein